MSPDRTLGPHAHTPGTPGAHAHPQPTPGADDFGVNKITISYHWRGEQYEVDLDPNKLDIMIFGSANIKKFKPPLPGKAGGPVKGSMNHLMPDGTMRAHDPKVPAGYWPFDEAGVMGAPRRIGLSVGGSPDDFCWHNPACFWWCVAGDHTPLDQ